MAHYAIINMSNDGKRYLWDEDTKAWTQIDN